MPIPDSIANYLRMYTSELGERILESFPPLHAVDDQPSPMIAKLLRKPYPAQTLAIMGLVRRRQTSRAAAAIAECGTGKTLVSLGAVHTHAEDRPIQRSGHGSPSIGREMGPREFPNAATDAGVHHRRTANADQRQKSLRRQ